MVIAFSGCNNEIVRSFEGGEKTLEYGKIEWDMFVVDGQIGSDLYAYASFKITPENQESYLHVKNIEVFDGEGVVQFRNLDFYLYPEQDQNGELAFYYFFDSKKIPFSNYTIHFSFLPSSEDASIELEGKIQSVTKKRNSYISKF